LRRNLTKVSRVCAYCMCTTPEKCHALPREMQNSFSWSKPHRFCSKLDNFENSQLSYYI